MDDVHQRPDAALFREKVLLVTRYSNCVHQIGKILEKGWEGFHWDNWENGKNNIFRYIQYPKKWWEKI